MSTAYIHCVRMSCKRDPDQYVVHLAGRDADFTKISMYFFFFFTMCFCYDYSQPTRGKAVPWMWLRSGKLEWTTQALSLYMRQVLV